MDYESRKAKFNELFNYYRFEADAEKVYDLFSLSEEDYVESKDSAYALLFACSVKNLIGEVCISEGITDAMYYLFKTYPSIFSICVEKIKYLPAIDQKMVKLEMFNCLWLQYLIEEIDDTQYQKRDIPTLEKKMREALPKCEVFFPSNLHISDIKACIDVRIADRNDETANIRNAPNGKVLTQLANQSIITIDSIVGTWCRIRNNYYTIGSKEGKIADNADELWVHLSCIACDIHKYGLDVDVHTAPNEKSSKTTFEKGDETHIEQLFAIKNNWVKVKLKNGHIGWVDNKEITYCP